MMDALDAYTDSLRDLDANLARLEAKVDALPSRAFIAGVLVRAVIVTMAVVVLAFGVLGGLAYLVAR